jgi:hypothetical protein
MAGVTAFTPVMTCPACRREDRRKYGEALIHTVHQVPDIGLCAHHGYPLQSCGITAEPDYYVALDDISEFRTTRFTPTSTEHMLMMAREALRLSQGGERAGAVADFRGLFEQMSSHASSPALQMLMVACSLEVPEANGSRSEMNRQSQSTDERWLRIARHFLPRRLAWLRDSYPRRVAWLTLRREIELHARARLPARAHIPQTAAFIDALVETKEAYAERVTKPLGTNIRAA